MNGTANKKEFFYIVVLILTFITVVVGATFALYSLIFKQEEGTSAVYTGTFSINYLDGDIIGRDKFLKPTEEVPNLETVDNVYRNEFGVESLGTLDGVISVNIEIKRNDFPDKDLMYALYDKEKEEAIADGSLELEGKEEIKIADGIELDGGATKEFILFIWWKWNPGEQQNPGCVELPNADDVENPSCLPPDDVKPLIFLGNLRINADQKRNY